MNNLLTLHILTTPKAPIEHVVMSVNIHSPEELTIWYVDDDRNAWGTSTIQQSLEEWCLERNILVKCYNLKQHEKPDINTENINRLDVKIGATHVHLSWLNRTSNIEIWATASNGLVSTRLDEKVESIVPSSVLTLDERLEFRGLKIRKEPVTNIFDVKWLIDQGILVKDNYGNTKFKRKITHDNNLHIKHKTNRWELTDSSGNKMVLDSPERGGYWLEEIVKQALRKCVESTNWVLFGTTIIELENEDQQNRRGLKNILKSFPYNQLLKIIIMNKLNYNPWIIKKINFSPEETRMLLEDEYIREEAYSRGGKNEMDSLLSYQNNLHVIEVKNTRPTIKHVEKLLTVQKKINPIDNRCILVHSVDFSGDRELEREIANIESTYRSVRIIHWTQLLTGFDLDNWHKDSDVLYIPTGKVYNPYHNPAIIGKMRPKGDEKQLELELKLELEIMIFMMNEEDLKEYLQYFYGVKKSDSGQMEIIIAPRKKIIFKAQKKLNSLIIQCTKNNWRYVEFKN